MAVARLRKRQVSGIALDHAGVVTRDLAALAAQYEHLGFTLTPLARQADGRIGNRCAMLHRSYVELLAVVDPSAGSATLDRFLARYAGVHILAFAIDDWPAVLARFRRAGIAAPSVADFDRPIDDIDPAGPRARFELIQLPDQPEGRINLVRHLTPEALWQQRFLRHANNAAALDEVVLAVTDPAEAAARFSRLIGCVVITDPAGGFALELARGRVRLLPPDTDASAVPCITGLRVRTSDGNVAIGRLLAERGIPHGARNNALIVHAVAAGGVVVRFVPAA
jgi:catechol 2,3-dioxygenase-like lactoylglutathione lyase family enzyme